MPADDWRRDKNKHYQEPLLTRNLNLVELLKKIGSRHGRTPGQVAVAWVLRQPAVTSALIGASSVAQLEQNVAALDAAPLTDAEIAAIEPHAVHGTEHLED